jgi:hypothetical protein
MKKRECSRTAILLIPLLMAGQPAIAENASGSSALALASLIGARSPFLSAEEKRIIESLFDNHFEGMSPSLKEISVEADTVVCRASNVDITSRSCSLIFDGRSVRVTGRAAHELSATLREVGAVSEGAAGSIFVSVSRPSCTIDLHAIAQKSGSGAYCTFGIDTQR